MPAGEDGRPGGLAARRRLTAAAAAHLVLDLLLGDGPVSVGVPGLRGERDREPRQGNAGQKNPAPLTAQITTSIAPIAANVAAAPRRPCLACSRAIAALRSSSCWAIARNVPRVEAAVITISTSVSRGQAQDVSGARLAELAREAGADVVATEVLPDDAARIEERLRAHVDAGVAFVLTTGGTGLTPDDVTPEATRAVIERDAPGFAEAMRAESRRFTPLGILSRGVSGVAGRTLLVNFPGNPKAIDQLFGVLAPTLAHVTETLRRDAGG